MKSKAFLRSLRVFQPRQFEHKITEGFASPWVNLFFLAQEEEEEKSPAGAERHPNNLPYPCIQAHTLSFLTPFTERHVWYRLCLLVHLAMGLIGKQLSLPCLCSFCCSVGGKKKEKKTIISFLQMNVSYNLFLIKNAIFNKKSRACLYHFQAGFALKGMNICSFYFHNSFQMRNCKCYWLLGSKQAFGQF